MTIRSDLHDPTSVSRFYDWLADHNRHTERTTRTHGLLISLLIDLDSTPDDTWRDPRVRAAAAALCQLVGDQLVPTVQRLREADAWEFSNVTGEFTQRRPIAVVYGSPLQLAQLLDSLGQVVEHEPDESFADDTVRKAARALTEMLERRLVDTG